MKKSSIFTGTSLFKKLAPVILITLISAIPLYSQPTPAGTLEPKQLSENSERKPAKEITEIIPLETPVSSSKTIETKNFKITVSSKGGEITEFLHFDRDSKLRDKVNLTDPDPFPFQVYSNEENRRKLRTSNYVIETTSEKGKKIITARLPIKAMIGNDSVKAELIKSYTFSEDSHFWEFSWALKHSSPDDLILKGYYFYPVTLVGPAGDEKSPRSAQTNYNFQHVGTDFDLFYMGSGDSFFSCGSSGETKFSPGQVDFFGRSSRFMTSAFMPLFENDGLYFFPDIIVSGQGKAIPQQMHLQLKPLVSENGSSQLKFAVFTGPKVKDLLQLNSDFDSIFPWRKKIHPDLYKAFDFGITAPIRDIIVAFLNLLYKAIPNYGVGIILFALLFKLVFFPLNQKQAESMKKMSALQPLMKEINEKYKENPQEKQRRTLALYKEHKVNPMGGCLPMIIQIPIFIALYSAFSDSYDLWKSPFIPGWIPDLSEPDVVFLLPESWPVLGGFAMHALPLLMTVTQFFQTKMTMVSGDDNQKKIMQLMPLIMLFFFWSMPAGVVLYWTIQNILSVAQQVYTNTKKKD